jgi:hypothetical protein
MSIRISRGRWCTGGPAEDSLVMWLEADRRLSMLDRAVESNELFWFSTTKMQWEQLDAPQVSGSPPSSRHDHGMLAVGSDLYVMFGSFEGDTRRCAAGNWSGCMPDRAPRRCSAHGCGACGHILCSSRVPCRAAPKFGDSGPLPWHSESPRGRR